MKLLEYEGKEFFKTREISIPPSGGVIRSTAGLTAALRRAGKGPWVLKAQVLAGGRGKAGGIKIAKTPEEAKVLAKAMLGMKLVTHQTQGQEIVVREILVDKAVDIAREMYFCVTMDRHQACPVVVASAEGGVEIEELARTKPEAIMKEWVDPVRGLEDFQARRLAFGLNIPAEKAGEAVKVAIMLVRLFLDLDASLVEVNPLIFTKKGELLALDAKVVTDDNALFRHKDLAERTDVEASPAEREAKRVGISFIGLDGNIGCLVNGAGLAMATMDTVKLAGGSPANFLDVGGGANAEQVRRAFQIILKDQQVEAILVNIFGGIMKCSTIAQGILEAVKKMKLKVPLIVRLEGTEVDQGKKLLADSGLKLIQAESLWDAAQKAVAAIKTNGNARRGR